jgi:uncharacterized protein
MTSKLKLICFIWGITLLFPQLLFAQNIDPKNFPVNDGFVTDQANILDPTTEQNLESLLSNLQKEKGVEIAVVTIQTLNDYPIEDYTLALGRYWGVGQKEVNSGLIFLTAPNDRQTRIEVGYGIEGTLTDAQSFQITNQLIPYFKNSEYQQGIIFGTNQIVQTIQTGYIPKTVSVTSSGESILNFGILLVIGLSWIGGILGRSKSIWAGGIIGSGSGAIYGFLTNSLLPILGLGLILGLLFDYIVSKSYKSSNSTPWWAGGNDSWWDGPRGGGSSSGGGFGGFGGGSFGGGGSTGRW